MLLESHLNGALTVAESVDRDDVGVCNRLIDDFDGHDTVQHCILGTVNRPLPARGYPLKDFVSAYSLEHRC